MVGLLQLDFESCLLVGILALTKMSLIDIGFLNVTIMFLLTNGLVTMDLSNMGKYLLIIIFNGRLPLLYMVIIIRGCFSFFFSIGGFKHCRPSSIDNDVRRVSP